MILKIEYAKNGWAHLEGNRIYHEEISKERIGELDDKHPRMFLNHPEKNGRRIVKIRIFEDENGRVNYAVTDCPTFLLNKDGKTIDRIN